MSAWARSGPPAESVAAVPDRLEGAAIAGVRIVVAVLWLVNVGWKLPPDFGERERGGLYLFTSWAVEFEVFGPFAWVVREVVLPNFRLFGWAVFVVEACLGGFLLVGLATRGWALVGAAQSVAIALSVLNAPHEWPWSYYLLIAVHLLLFATAAGRSWGLDGVLRPVWAGRQGPWSRLALRLS
jgi:thiosulfate dehydrogenase [quinone] large subunit